MMQTSGDRREVLDPDRHVARALLEDATAFVLSEIPPPLRLLDRDQRRARRPWSAERLLARDERVMLGAGDVSLVARDASQHPDRIFE